MSMSMSVMKEKMKTQMKRRNANEGIDARGTSARVSSSSSALQRGRDANGNARHGLVHDV